MKPQTQPQLIEVALACARRGDFKGMAEICRGVLAREPNQPDALHCMGLLHRRIGDIPTSIDCHERSVKGRPGNAEYRNALGLAYRASNRAADAIDAFETAIRIDPNFIDAYVNVGQTYFGRGDYRTAVARFRDAIERKPATALLHVALARGLAAQGDERGAEASYRRALTLEGGAGPAYSGLGDLYYARGDSTRALAAFKDGVATDPLDPGNYLRAVPLLVALDRIDDAIYLLQDGLKQTPDVAALRVALAKLLMRQERWAECWEHYERRLSVPPFLNARHRFAQKPWNGRIEPGMRLCVNFEHGLAESLALLRYIEPLISGGIDVIIQCPALIRETLAPLQSRITICGPNDPLPAFDRHVWLATLPLMLGQPDPSTLASAPRGLEALADAAFWRTRCADLPRPLVGLHWRGPGRSQLFQDSRNLLAAFTDFDGGLVALQDRTAASEIAESGMIERVVHVGAAIASDSDIACEMAKAAAQCDIVISVDSPLVQTAGLLGRPTLALIDGSEDFPWPLDRASTGWFPTVSLLRKHKSEDDAAFIGRIREASKAVSKNFGTVR